MSYFSPEADTTETKRHLVVYVASDSNECQLAEACSDPAQANTRANVLREKEDILAVIIVDSREKTGRIIEGTMELFDATVEPKKHPKAYCGGAMSFDTVVA